PQAQTQMLGHLATLLHFSESQNKEQASNRAAQLQLSRVKAREDLARLDVPIYLLDELESDWASNEENKAALDKANQLVDSAMFVKKFDRMYRF
uniref:hypothetical protein n=1 Tax=Vibrio vulnificus TaxID=672 RepID=UPI0039B39FBA